MSGTCSSVSQPKTMSQAARIIPGDGDGDENSSLTVIVKTVRNVQSVFSVVHLSVF